MSRPIFIKRNTLEFELSPFSLFTCKVKSGLGGDMGNW